MRELRTIGFIIENTIKEQNLDLSCLLDDLNYNREEFGLVVKGRKFLSFNQLQKIADFFKVDVEKLLEVDNKKYEKEFVHCMTDFTESDNREQILDDIYDYLDLLDITNEEAC